MRGLALRLLRRNPRTVLRLAVFAARHWRLLLAGLMTARRLLAHSPRMRRRRFRVGARLVPGRRAAARALGLQLAGAVVRVRPGGPAR